MATTDTPAWPLIPVGDWQDTRDTLHLYTQVVGKIRLANEPRLHHWNVPLYVSARGLPTALTPHRSGRLPLNDGTERPVADACTHLDTIREVTPSSDGCEDCLRIGARWVHLRLCMRCGHVGCCDNSPNHHATAHWNAHADHPLIRSYEPGEDWWWCYPDELFFEVEGAAPARSHP